MIGALLSSAGAWVGLAWRQQRVRFYRERAETAEALRESQALYHSLVTQLPIGIFQKDAQGRYALVNPGFCQVKGMRAEDFLGKTPSEVARSEAAKKDPAGLAIKHAAAGEDHHQRIMQTGRSIEVEEEYLLANGTRRCLQVLKLPVLDSDGKVIGTQGVQFDITERKRAEADLLKTNRALQLISLFNQELVRITDEQALLQAACDLAVQKGGYRLAWVGFAQPDEAKSVRPVAHSGFDDGYLDALNITWSDTERGRGPAGTAIRTGQPVIARNLLTEPEFGPWREDAMKRGYASAIALPLQSGGRCSGVLMLYAAEPEACNPDEMGLLGELAGDLAYGIGALRHRAEREKAEAEVERTAQEWQTTFDATNDAIWILDQEQRVLRSNKTAEQIFQRPCGEMLGRPCWIIVHGTAEPLPDCPFLRARQSGRREIMELRLGNRWLEVTVDPIRDASGRFAGAVHIVSDITERKRAEEQIRVLNAELEQRVPNAPRNSKPPTRNWKRSVIPSPTICARRCAMSWGLWNRCKKSAGASLSEIDLRHLKTIAQAAGRMGELIDDLLAFSRVGRAELRKTDVNLDELVRETAERFPGGNARSETSPGKSTRCRRCGRTAPCCAWRWSI